LDGELDGDAFVSGGGCVVVRQGCPDYDEPGVFDAERGPGRGIEDYEGDEPTARLKSYALYYYFAVEVYGVKGAGRRVMLPQYDS
jgi:hypothetical protein